MASVAQIQTCKILNDILARRGATRVDVLLAEARPILHACGRSEGTAKNMLTALVRAGIVSRDEDKYKSEKTDMASALARLLYEIDHFVPRKDVLIQTSSDGILFVIHMAFAGNSGFYAGDDRDISKIEDAIVYDTPAKAMAEIKMILETWNLDGFNGIGFYRIKS